MNISLQNIGFDTERLVVGEWHSASKGDRAGEDAGLDLVRSVAMLMTPRTTQALPEAWRGDYSLDRAERWIAERDAESPTFLVTDRKTGEAIGMLIVFFDPAGAEGSGGDLRIGYLLSEAVWGQGLASELVAGLVGWTTADPGITTVTAGVEASNSASRKVLVKNGFEQLNAESEGELTYRRSC